MKLSLSLLNFVMSAWNRTTKFNDRQYFQLYGIMVTLPPSFLLSDRQQKTLVVRQGKPTAGYTRDHVFLELSVRRILTTY